MVGGAVGAIIGSFWLANYFYSATMRKGEMEVRKKLVAEITAAESK